MKPSITQLTEQAIHPRGSVRLILIGLLTVISVKMMAQNNNLPYSQMGIGDLEDSYYNRTSGMGNTGIAYRSNRYLIQNNPASFSALSDQFFTMELGIRGEYISYAGTPVNVASTESGDITFRKLVLGLKLGKHWGTSAGLVPFSTQNYTFSVPYNLVGTTVQIANSFYQGHGSVNKAYWANSYEFFHHLSLGVEAGYIFGQLNQNNIIQATANSATLVSSTNDLNLNNLYFTYGMQLYGNLGKKLKYTIGATYSAKASLLAAGTKLVLNNDSVTLQNIQNNEGYLNLPNAYGAGLSITYKDKYTFLADYRYQNWNGVATTNDQEYPGQGYNIVSAERGSVGFEVSKKKTFYNTRIELTYLQAGLYYGNTYLQINGQQIKDMGITAGIGANSLKSPLAYDIIFQYGIKGTTANNLIRQNYADVTFVLNFGQIWYTKGKKFD
jgi:hypothetical protein